MAPITLAVAGATGLTGAWITRALLSPEYFPKQIARVVALTRDPNSKVALGLKAAGAELAVPAPTPATFKNVDVFVNASNPAKDSASDDYAKAAIDAGVKVYFPSEFGLDPYTYHSDNALHSRKKAHAKLCEEYSNGRVKIVRFTNGSFFNYGSPEWSRSLGFDHWAGRYTVLGDPTTKLSYTHLGDIGRSIARLAVLSVSDPASVPDIIRIQGDTKSFNELAHVVGKRLGKTIEVVAVSPNDVKREASDFVTEIRILLASGEGDNSRENHNEPVNPGERCWKWATLASWMENDGNLPFASTA